MDTRICEEFWDHFATAHHRREECPVTLEDEANAEMESDFIRRYGAGIL